MGGITRQLTKFDFQCYGRDLYSIWRVPVINDNIWGMFYCSTSDLNVQIESKLAVLDALPNNAIINLIGRPSTHPTAYLQI